MAEPLFYDCLTDMQMWSLFDSGVLDGFMLPREVFERLQSIAPAHGGYVFTWPTSAPSPALEDIFQSLELEIGAATTHGHRTAALTCSLLGRLHAAVETLRARLNRNQAAAGGRIHLITTIPQWQLRAGPYLEPPSLDLTAMTTAELEAYLDKLFQVP